MKMKKIIIEVIAVLYISLMLYAAISKLLKFELSREQLTLMPFLEPSAAIVAWLLPVVEILISCLIFLPMTRIAGLIAATVLMFIFTCYILYIVNYSPHLPCTCGGVLDALSWTQHLILNIVFVFLGCCAIYLLNKTNDRQFKVSMSQFVGRSFFMPISIYTLLGSCNISHSVEAITGLEGTDIPVFNLTLLDSSETISTSELAKGRPMVMLYISPNCPFCRIQTRRITANIDKLSELQFCIFSSGNLKELRQYSDLYHLSRYKNIIVAKDTAAFFQRYFKSNQIPFTVIYNTNGKLSKAFIGPVDTRLLLSSAME
jgi:hypothetical protein